MDNIALEIVKKYVEEHLDKTNENIKESDKEPFVVWKCKVLQNWKYLLSTRLPDGMYYELTFNGNKKNGILMHIRNLKTDAFQ